MSDGPTCGDIALRLNLVRRAHSWRGDCPACEYARAFSLSEGRNGRPLLYCSNGCDQAALQHVASGVGAVTAAQAPQPDEAARAAKRERALALWRGSEAIPGTLAERYLAARHVPHLAASPDLRFRPDCWNPEGGKYPALIALVRGPDGEPTGVWRTYLRRDGSGKADIDPPRAGLGPVAGAAVRLAPIAAELAIGEGIETSAAAGVLTGLPAWAALSAGNLARGLILPTSVRRVVIAVDRDAPGEAAAMAAADRWRGEGRHVRLLWPDRAGADAADVLAVREVAHA